MSMCERCDKRKGDFCDTGKVGMFGEPIEYCICEKCLEELEQEYSERQKVEVST